MEVMTIGEPEAAKEVMRDVTSDGMPVTTGWVMIEVMTEGEPDTVTVMREVTTPLWVDAGLTTGLDSSRIGVVF